ncbi:MAG TPA: YbaB/EbfC family nucleoid-associated protein [Jatrophihabitantaceae bacterium]
MTSESGLSGEGLDQLLTSARQALEAARSGTAADREPIEAVGTAGDDEQIRVTVRTPGEVTSIQLDPRAMRLPSEDLAEQLTLAVNQALTALRANAVAAVAPVDLDTLNGQLENLHQESIRQMERFSSAVGGAVDQIRRRGGT